MSVIVGAPVANRGNRLHFFSILEVTMRKTDAQLQRDVIDELRWDPRVGSSEIGVAARDGVITLSGAVDSYAKKCAAVEAAERVAGVRTIADELNVALPSSRKRTDTDLAHAVANTLKWDIQVPDETVKARVDDGWVWLEGDVEWRYQSVAAEQAIRMLTGIRGVTNGIRIRSGSSASNIDHHPGRAWSEPGAAEQRHGLHLQH